MTRNPVLSLAPSQVGPVRVAVTSDDPLMRASVQRLLAAVPEVAVVASADAQVALVDLGPDRARALARLTELRASSVPVVVVVPDGSLVSAALAAGARGVVHRDSIGPEWSAALTAVEAGLTVIDAPLAENLISARPMPPPVVRDAGAPRPSTGQLTERERQVVALLAEGLSNKLIADRLGISDHTAKFHVNGVMAKLSAGTRTEAVVEAVRRGLVTL